MKTFPMADVRARIADSIAASGIAEAQPAAGVASLWIEFWLTTLFDSETEEDRDHEFAATSPIFERWYHREWSSSPGDGDYRDMVDALNDMEDDLLDDLFAIASSKYAVNWDDFHDISAGASELLADELLAAGMTLDDMDNLLADG